MRMLDIQNLQLSHDNFDISTNDLNLANDVWYIETSTNLYFNFSDKGLQQATNNPSSKSSSKFTILLYFFCETNIMPYNS